MKESPLEVFECPLCDTVLNSDYVCEKCNRSFSEEIKCNYGHGELTVGQAAKQDCVDNACFALIREFIPDAEWDIEKISRIRDSLVSVLESYGMKEYDVYPWLLEIATKE